MSYQALYRVWRPQQFIDVVGQQHVTKTLQNALLQEKTSHAYLFSGPRGTGKTSAAKILAKAVNCEKAPVKEPCNECAACKGITDGTIPDVIEIDAASNNGVEEIRDIRDKVKFAPNVVKYKVYIVDEVHMLSIGAFNALLKTLEEPPQHVIFILATTEPHKIPLTIISRCQRFDFKRITAFDIVGRMSLIADETNVSYEDKAMHIIARAAEGGMRDALSLLDQAISFSGEKLTLEDALMVTGSVSQTFLNELALAVHEKNISSGLHALEELLYQGKDAARFIEDFIMFYRDMLLYKTAPTLEESLDRVMLDEEFQTLTSKYATEDIYSIIDVLNKTQQEMKWTNHPKILLEIAIVKLCQTETRSAKVGNIPEVQTLMEKIDQLEAEIRKLKTTGVAVQESNPSPQTRGQRPTTKSHYKVPVGRINEILKSATKQDLQVLKSRWGDMLNILAQQQMRSQAALLNEAEPVAASDQAFVLKFKYEIHCKMAMENTQFVDMMANSFQELIGKRMQMVGIPDDQWSKIREEFIQGQPDESNSSGTTDQTEDPFIAEAKKLVGADLLEIKD